MAKYGMGGRAFAECSTNKQHFVVEGEFVFRHEAYPAILNRIMLADLKTESSTAESAWARSWWHCMLIPCKENIPP
jgi:hypothetical protein